MQTKENYEEQVLEISAEDFAKVLDFKVFHASTKNIRIDSRTLNRPGLFLTGYHGYFPSGRVQVMGRAESSYLNSISREEKCEKLDDLFSQNIPCVILAFGIVPSDDFIKIATKYDISVFNTGLTTSQTESLVWDYLSQELARRTMIHGELLDISGVGVLIIGDSGIGKSETALELVHRGQLLVADDLVSARNVKGKIYGYSQDKIKNYIEIRGVGIINVEAMYGIGSVLPYKEIHFVIQMVKWQDDVVYDRLGDDNLTYNILGKELPMITIPVTAGRNLAIVIEAATRNFRLKQMGMDPLKDLLKIFDKDDN